MTGRPKPPHSPWGQDPSGICYCQNCSAPDDVEPERPTMPRRRQIPLLDHAYCPGCGRWVAVRRATAIWRGPYALTPHRDETYRRLCPRSNSILRLDEVRL